MLNTREVLQNLLAKPYLPFTVMSLREEVEELLSNNPTDEPQKMVPKFLYSKLKELVQALNFPLLSEISTTIKTSILNTENKAASLKLKNNPTLEEATEFCSILHVEMQALQQHREELAHYLSFFTQAKGYVNSFAQAAEIVLKDWVEGRKELKSQKDSLLNDLEVYKTYLSSLSKDLEKIGDEVIGPRITLCVKMESSLRLLEKYRDPSARGFSLS